MPELLAGSLHKTVSQLANESSPSAWKVALNRLTTQDRLTLLRHAPLENLPSALLSEWLNEQSVFTSHLFPDFAAILLNPTLSKERVEEIQEWAITKMKETRSDEYSDNYRSTGNFHYAPSHALNVLESSGYALPAARYNELLDFVIEQSENLHTIEDEDSVPVARYLLERSELLDEDSLDRITAIGYKDGKILKHLAWRPEMTPQRLAALIRARPSQDSIIEAAVCREEMLQNAEVREALLLTRSQTSTSLIVPHLTDTEYLAYLANISMEANSLTRRLIQESPPKPEIFSDAFRILSAHAPWVALQMLHDKANHESAKKLSPSDWSIILSSQDSDLRLLAQRTWSHIAQGDFKHLPEVPPQRRPRRVRRR